MTPEQLLAWAHENSGTKKRSPTKAERLLALYACRLQSGYSAAFNQDAFKVALEQKAELPKLNLDTQEPVT